MNKDIKREELEAVRALYDQDEGARALFDSLAERERDASATSIETMSRITTLSRGSSVALARALAEAGCGEFVVGRRKQKSRFIWMYSCISLGRAAAGESTNIEEPQDPAQEEEEYTRSAPELDQTTAPRNPILAIITKAKEQIAADLGVLVSSIEITIRT